MFIQRAKRIDAEIDMTPLIDVVFQLLIFLMVSSQFTKPSQKVDLPIGATTTETIKSPEANHILTITSDQKILLDDTSISTENISEQLHQHITEHQIKSLEIRGDKAAQLGLFIEVIEAAKSSGITKLSYHKKTKQPSLSL